MSNYDVRFKRDSGSIVIGTNQGKVNDNDVHHMKVTAETCKEAETYAIQFQKENMNKDIRIINTISLDIQE